MVNSGVAAARQRRRYDFHSLRHHDPGVHFPHLDLSCWRTYFGRIYRPCAVMALLRNRTGVPSVHHLRLRQTSLRCG